MNNIIKHTFDFENSTIRVLGSPNNPQFIAKDVCKILGLTNVSQATSTIPEKWRGITANDTPSGVHLSLTPPPPP